MINSFIKNKLLLGFVMVSLLTTSFGGVFAASASAATPDNTAPEDSVQASSSSNGILAAIAAVGLIAALSNHGSSSDNGSASNVNPGSSGGSSGGSAGQTSGTSITAEEQQAVSLMNNDRAANGLPALKINLKLTQLARNYAQDMINRGFFAHNNPEGLSPFDRMRQAGISYVYAGENLAINSTVAGAEKAFMNSPGHRANILSPNYTEVGIGVIRSPRGSVYVVQEFIGK